eukprot:SAG31_NODE_21204_length_555_cov_1.017544_1_plen_123_part_10
MEKQDGSATPLFTAVAVCLQWLETHPSGVAAAAAAIHTKAAGAMREDPFGAGNSTHRQIEHVRCLMQLFDCTVPAVARSLRQHLCTLRATATSAPFDRTLWPPPRMPASDWIGQLCRYAVGDE